MENAAVDTSTFSPPTTAFFFSLPPSRKFFQASGAKGCKYPTLVAHRQFGPAAPGLGNRIKNSAL
jgi:hypothetical protein